MSLFEGTRPRLSGGLDSLHSIWSGEFDCLAGTRVPDLTYMEKAPNRHCRRGTRSCANEAIDLPSCPKSSIVYAREPPGAPQTHR